MDLEQARTQYDILCHLDRTGLPGSHIDIGEMSSELGLNYVLCHICCAKMEAKGHIKPSDVDSSTPRFLDNHLVKITIPGKGFLASDTTYESEYEANLLEVEEEKRKEDLRLQNLESDTELLRRNLKTYNLRLWITIITVVCLVLGLLITLGIQYYQEATSTEIYIPQNPQQR